MWIKLNNNIENLKVGYKVHKTFNKIKNNNIFKLNVDNLIKEIEVLVQAFNNKIDI